MTPIFIEPPEKEITPNGYSCIAYNYPVNIAIVKSMIRTVNAEYMKDYGYDPFEENQQKWIFCILFMFLGDDKMPWTFKDEKSRDEEYFKLLDRFGHGTNKD